MFVIGRSTPCLGALCSWGLGLGCWARFRGDSGAGLRAWLLLRPPSQDQPFTSWPPPWKLFTVRLQEAIPSSSKCQKLSETHKTWIVRGWPYREPTQENTRSRFSNEWTAINLKQTTLFLLLSIGNEIMKGTHKLSKQQHSTVTRSKQEALLVTVRQYQTRKPSTSLAELNQPPSPPLPPQAPSGKNTHTGTIFTSSSSLDPSYPSGRINSSTPFFFPEISTFPFLLDQRRKKQQWSFW